MKQSELNNLTSEELQSELSKARLNYGELSRLHSMSPIESPSEVTKARKLIARLLTAINSK